MLAPRLRANGRAFAQIAEFHPELTVDQLAGWLGNGGADYLVAHGADPDELLDRTRAEAPRAVVRTHRLVDRFLDRVAHVGAREASGSERSLLD